MQFKTFTSYDSQDLDQQINLWLTEAFSKRLQILDLKANTCFSNDGKPFFTTNLIYQEVPEKKEIPNPCCKKED